MEGFQISATWILCVASALLSQQIVIVSAVYTMNQTCAEYSTGFIADPDSCDSYGYCENGVLRGVGKCPDGFEYNSAESVCDVASAGSCSNINVASACKYAPDGSFVADPNNCQRFCQCNNKVPQCNDCPKGQLFDSSKTRCVWSSQLSSPCLADSICRLVPNGKFIGDPDVCGQYMNCISAVATPGQCPKNTYYNKKIAMCQYDNPCENPTPVGVGLGVLTPLAMNPEACQTQKGPFPQYVADKKTCMGYYVCTSSAGPGTWSKCPSGLHFNAGKCVTPFTFPCAYDRCGNIKQGFVGAVGSECKNYLICENQTSKPATSGYLNYVGLPCPKNQFFNEFTQTCGDKYPASNTYKLCP